VKLVTTTIRTAGNASGMGRAEALPCDAGHHRPSRTPRFASSVLGAIYCNWWGSSI